MPEPLGIFADLVASLAPAVGGSEILASYLIGFAIVFAVFISVVIAFSKSDAEIGSGVMFIAAGFGVTLVVGVGLWDIWAVVFIGIILAWLFVNPLSSGGSE